MQQQGNVVSEYIRVMPHQATLNMLRSMRSKVPLRLGYYFSLGFKILLEGCQMRLDSVHKPIGMLWGIIEKYDNTSNYPQYIPIGLWN